MNEIPEGMKALRDEMVEWVGFGFVSYDALFGALLAPDGPLWPALRALGAEAQYALDIPSYFAYLKIPKVLADACLAAAEVQP